jgi:hypothetical protein
MNTVVLFRNLDNNDELEIAKQYFPVVSHRSDCKNCLVIPRYSALPFYEELEYDLKSQNCYMMNTYKQHRWIANFEYYRELESFTTETYDDYTFHAAPEGQYVVKGKTNSHKFLWDKKMFAPTKKDAIRIGSELMEDTYLSQQGLIYRKYEPLETFEIGLNGLPFTNEYRFFFLGINLLSCGYYWSIAEKTDYEVPKEAINLARTIAIKVSKSVNFFVLDIAKTVDGRWILIEINDGQQSGLSENDPHRLYGKLASIYNNPNAR